MDGFPLKEWLHSVAGDMEDRIHVTMAIVRVKSRAVEEEKENDFRKWKLVLSVVYSRSLSIVQREDSGLSSTLKFFFSSSFQPIRASLLLFPTPCEEVEAVISKT